MLPQISQPEPSPAMGPDTLSLRCPWFHGQCELLTVTRNKPTLLSAGVVWGARSSRLTRLPLVRFSTCTRSMDVSLGWGTIRGRKRKFGSLSVPSFCGIIVSVRGYESMGLTWVQKDMIGFLSFSYFLVSLLSFCVRDHTERMASQGPSASLFTQSQMWHACLALTLSLTKLQIMDQLVFCANGAPWKRQVKGWLNGGRA